jgi:DNA-binding NarL/FixJ family response regulator
MQPRKGGVTTVASRERPVRVVVIDDTIDIRELLRVALSRGGMEVVGEARDGQEGIDVVREERPDVVMLDLAMPVMDGVEALPHIRELVPDAQIIVFVGVRRC